MGLEVVSVRLSTVRQVRVVFVDSVVLAHPSPVELCDLILSNQCGRLPLVEAVDGVSLEAYETAEGLHLLVLDDGVYSLHLKFIIIIWNTLSFYSLGLGPLCDIIKA